MKQKRRQHKSEAEPTRGPHPALVMVVVWGVAFLLYANTIGHDYVWDDHHIIVRNPAIQTFDGNAVRAAFTEEFWPAPHREGDYYRPVSVLSFHLNYAVTGDGAAGFHLFNVLGNALACALACLFVYLYFGSAVLALTTGLLFATHPAHTESVAWIAGRTDIIATAWMMLSLSAYALYMRARRLPWLVASAFAFFVALLAKESAACLPLIVVAMELIGLPGRKRTGEGARRFVGPAVTIVVLMVYMAMRMQAIGSLASNHPTIATTLASRVALPFSAFAGYVGKLLLPLQLNAEYDAPIPSSPADVNVGLGVLALALLLFAAWRFKKPAITLGTAVVLFGLAPALNILPIGEVSAERFLYLPSLGFALIAGWIFASALVVRYPRFGGASIQSGMLGLSRPVANVISLIFVIVLVLWTTRTVTRNGDWKNDSTLFTKTAQQSPDNPRALVNLGNIARQRGDMAEAEEAYRAALAVSPAYPEALSNLAGIYASRGQLPQAIELMERALPGWPDNADLRRNLGYAYMAMKQYERAAVYVGQSLELEPDNATTRILMGSLLMETGEFERARPHLEQAAQAGPKYVIAYYHLAVLEREQGNSERARQLARHFLSQYPQDDQYREYAKLIAEGR